MKNPAYTPYKTQKVRKTVKRFNPQFSLNHLPSPPVSIFLNFCGRTLPVVDRRTKFASQNKGGKKNGVRKMKCFRQCAPETSDGYIYQIRTLFYVLSWSPGYRNMPMSPAKFFEFDRVYDEINENASLIIRI